MAMASAPLSLTIPTPPEPGAVEIALIVSSCMLSPLKKIPAMLTGKILFINVVPLVNLDNQNNNFIVLNIGKNSIIADAVAPICIGVIG